MAKWACWRLCVAELIPLSRLRSRSMVTLPLSTIIFCSVPVGASVATAELARCGERAVRDAGRAETPHRGVATPIATSTSKGKVRAIRIFFNILLSSDFACLAGPPRKVVSSLTRRQRNPSKNFENLCRTADLKLARFPARSPLPVAALPSMSLIPSAPFTDATDEENDEQ
jgi:hypothetical protein